MSLSTTAAARQKEMNASMAVVATSTRGGPAFRHEADCFGEWVCIGDLLMPTSSVGPAWGDGSQRSTAGAPMRPEHPTTDRVVSHRLQPYAEAHKEVIKKA